MNERELRENRADLEAEDPGRFFMVRKTYLYFLSERAALLLSHLVSFYVWKTGIRGGHHKGWVEFSTTQIQKALPLSRHRLERALKELEDLQLVGVSLHGVPATRWIVVHGGTLRAQLREIDTTGPEGLPSCAKSVQLVRTRAQLAGEKTVRIASISCKNVREDAPYITTPKGKHCLDCVQTEWDRLAEQLSSMLAKTRGLNSNQKPRGWGEHLRKIHTLDSVPVERVVWAVKWYCGVLNQHGGSLTKSMIPECYSAATFREKYARVESAMEKRGVLRIKPTKPTTSSGPEIVPGEARLGL